MSTQIVTLELPQSLYQKLKARAEQTHHSVEDEALDVLATSVPSALNLNRPALVRSRRLWVEVGWHPPDD